MLRSSALSGLALAALGLGACNPSPPSYTVTDPKTGEKAEISIDTGGATNTITVNSEEGKASITISSDGKAPANMPSYIPAYPGAEYQGSFASNVSSDQAKKSDMKGGMVSFTTNDAPDKVLAYYKEAFTRGGLKEQASGNMGGMQMLSFTKGDTEQEGAQVMASAAGDGSTQIQIIYSTAQ
jgi:hypothetical protein